jgi:hypothetical protein
LRLVDLALRQKEHDGRGESEIITPP